MKTKKPVSINKETIEILCKSSQGNIRQIADKLGINIFELQTLAAQYEIELPSLAQKQFIKPVQKFEYVSSNSYDFLIFDDFASQTINGIPFGTDIFNPNAKIDVTKIWKFFHKTEPYCCFTGATSDLILYCYDNNIQNFLITNLDWVNKRYFEDNLAFLPFTIANIKLPISLKFYDTKCSFDLVVKIERLLSNSNPKIVSDTLLKNIKFWIADVLNNYECSKLFPKEVEATPELMLLWIWKQLTHKALVKGVLEIKLENSDYSFELNADHMTSLVTTNLRKKFSIFKI